MQRFALWVTPKEVSRFPQPPPHHKAIHLEITYSIEHCALLHSWMRHTWPDSDYSASEFIFEDELLP